MPLPLRHKKFLTATVLRLNRQRFDLHRSPPPGTTAVPPRSGPMNSLDSQTLEFSRPRMTRQRKTMRRNTIESRNTRPTWRHGFRSWATRRVRNSIAVTFRSNLISSQVHFQTDQDSRSTLTHVPAFFRFPVSTASARHPPSREHILQTAQHRQNRIDMASAHRHQLKRDNHSSQFQTPKFTRTTYYYFTETPTS